MLSVAGGGKVRAMTFASRWYMGRLLALCALLGVAGSLLIARATAAPEVAPLAVETKISLGDIAGRMDHLAFDPTRQRLYVAELGNDSIGIVDLKQNRLLRTVTGFSEPQGIAYEPATDSIYVANGGEGAVRIFRASDFAAVATVHVGADPDNVRVDASAHRVYVGYGSNTGALAIIDPATRTKIGDIALKKHPESFQLESGGDRIFVNVPDANEIAVVSRRSRAQVASWPTAPLQANFPMALALGRLVTVFRHPARLTAFDVQNGKMLASVEACTDADDAFVDAKRNRVYVLCGEGQVEVFEAAGTGYSRVGELTTSPGTRTGLFIAEREQLAVAIRASARSDAAVWLAK
jgi:DNA-binding beta-propeller fold protein YncE